MAQEAPHQSALEKRLYGLWELGGRELAAEAWKWPKEERMMLAKEFRAYLESGKFGKPVGDQPYHILIQLGDREATKNEVEKMAMDWFHYGGGFDSSGSPIAIEYLAPHAFSQEPYSESGTDVIMVPFSFMATSVIFRILSDSPAFTGEVASWARREKVPDPIGERAELQRWWKENKTHFEQEDYKAVQPGRPIASVFEVRDEERRKAGLPPVEDKRPKPPTPMPQPTTPKPAPAPLLAAEDDHSSKALYYLSAAGAAILAAVLAIFIRKKRVK